MIPLRYGGLQSDWVIHRLQGFIEIDVEAALRAFNRVRQVEFLNNHGTVLVRYQPGSERPKQLAGAVDRVLALGWNCSARVDGGE